MLILDAYFLHVIESNRLIAALNVGIDDRERHLLSQSLPFFLAFSALSFLSL